MSNETEIMRIKIAEWKEQGRDPDRAEQLFNLILHDMEWVWLNYWDMVSVRRQQIADKQL